MFAGGAFGALEACLRGCFCALEACGRGVFQTGRRPSVRLSPRPTTPYHPSASRHSPRPPCCAALSSLRRPSRRSFFGRAPSRKALSEGNGKFSERNQGNSPSERKASRNPSRSNSRSNSGKSANELV